jgi:hypothetical protein
LFEQFLSLAEIFLGLTEKFLGLARGLFEVKSKKVEVLLGLKKIVATFFLLVKEQIEEEETGEGLLLNE